MKFPEEAKLSPEAKDIINKLLCNVSHRLGTNGADEIKVLYGVSFSEYLDLLGKVVTNKKESRSCLFFFCRLIHGLMALNGIGFIRWKLHFFLR